MLQSFSTWSQLIAVQCQDMLSHDKFWQETHDEHLLCGTAVRLCTAVPIFPGRNLYSTTYKRVHCLCCMQLEPLSAVPNFGGQDSIGTTGFKIMGDGPIPTPRQLVVMLDQYVIGQPVPKRVSHPAASG